MRKHHIGLLAGGAVTGSGITMIEKCGYDIRQGRLTDNGTLYDQRVRSTLPQGQTEKAKILFPIELVEPISRDTGLSWTMTKVDGTTIIEVGSANVAETHHALQLLEINRKGELWCLPHDTLLKVSPCVVSPTQWHLGLCCETRDDIGAFLRLLPENPLRDQFIDQVPPRARKPREAGSTKELSGTFPVTIGGLKMELMFGPAGLHSHGFKGTAQKVQDGYWTNGKDAFKTSCRH